MREIKFRAWNKEDKKMYKVVRIEKSIYGYCEVDNLLICGLEADEHLKETDVRVSYDYELMQYTGLKDCKGKEVYEGDIVKYKAGTDEGIGYIKFEFSCFMIYWTNNKTFNDSFSSMFYTQCSSEIEVIGNIYEHPELLR